MQKINLNTAIQCKKIIEPIKKIVEPGELGLGIEIILKDRNGRIERQEVKKSNSFVRQFLELLFAHSKMTSGSLPVPAKNTDGEQLFVWATGDTFNCSAATGVTTAGIVVGSDVTTPTIDDYALGSLIAHGTGAGQLQYSALVFGAPASDGTTSQFTMSRNFTNGGGANVTVYEIGLIGSARAVLNYTGSSVRYFLLARDVIPDGVVIEDGKTLTLNYRVQATL